MAKQCSTEHDHLIHEFEKLTTDLDGLLGVLEDSLQECSGSEANFEAKELLCALFQVYIYHCKRKITVLVNCFFTIIVELSFLC